MTCAQNISEAESILRTLGTWVSRPQGRGKEKSARGCVSPSETGGLWGPARLPAAGKQPFRTAAPTCAPPCASNRSGSGSLLRPSAELLGTGSDQGGRDHVLTSSPGAAQGLVGPSHPAVGLGD